MKAKAITLIVCVAAMIFLAGCSGGDSSSGGANVVPGAPAGGVKVTPVAPPAGAPAGTKIGKLQ